MSLNDWEVGTEVSAEEEGAYLKDLCAALRNQQTLSKVENKENTYTIITDDLTAHAADIIEELWGRLDKYYIQGIEKGMELKADELAYEAIKKT
jgi:hypothetical protein